MVVEPFVFPTLIPQGYKMLPADAGAAEYGHVLFGPQAIDGGWCPNCDKPLLHLATIDTRDPRLGLAHLPHRHIPLLFCMRCAICQADGDVNLAGLYRHDLSRHAGAALPAYEPSGCEFFYHLAAEGRVDILIYNEGFDEEYLPYPHYPESFPGSGVQLLPISEEAHWYCQRSNRYWEEHPDQWERADYEAIHAFHEQYDHLIDWTHQLGGEPCFWNACAPTTCPCCGELMPFLAMIEDNDSAGTPRMSDEGGQIPFYLCQDCSIIGCYGLGT